MPDLLVLFAGTGQEPDEPNGQTVVWRLGHVLEGQVLYEPGLGTLGTLLSPIARAVGYGLEGVVDRQLDRVGHFLDHRIAVFGESRGAHAAREFCEQLPIRHQKVAHLFCAIDSVTATGWAAARRLLPRWAWRRPRVHRPPCVHGYHVTAAVEPHRFYMRDDIVGLDDIIPFPKFRHGQVLRDDGVLDMVVRLALGAGFYRREA